jgi:hypothetical protein
MKRLIPTITIIFLCLVSAETYCQLIIEGEDVANFDLYSKWQSLNNSNLVVEFTKSNQYVVFGDREQVFSLQFQIDREENGLFEISLYVDDADTEPGKVTIQIVNENRIRIYSWKHKTVLDTADEYYRTEDLNSFPSLIKRAINENK